MKYTWKGQVTSDNVIGFYNYTEVNNAMIALTKTSGQSRCCVIHKEVGIL